MNLLCIVASEQGAARGPAARGVVKLGEAQAITGEGVEVRGRDFAAVTPKVGIAEVIGEDEDDVRLWR
jgi:hypothetical protein